MISIEEALERVIGHVEARPAISVPVVDALDAILAAEVISAVDIPPYSKSLVDGFAVQAADCWTGRRLKVIDGVMAGQLPVRPVVPGTAVRIMTGAPIPEGADAVIMLEETSPTRHTKESEEIELKGSKVRLQRNILQRGAVAGAGDAVLPAGACLHPSAISLLCEIGHVSVPIIRAPRVAILTTGNEIVAHDQIPGPGQIRNSNGPLLTTLVRRAGGSPVTLGISGDESSLLRQHIVTGLEQDVLLISGGVSAGDLDLVPSTLEDVGVQPRFHGIDLRPGKPLWFGVWRPPGEDGVQTSRLVFGLPGNPASCLACFLLFVRPALRRMAGENGPDWPWQIAQLTTKFERTGGRTALLPAWLQVIETQLQVSPLPWHGSADMRALAQANCLALFPNSRQIFECGTPLRVLML